MMKEKKAMFVREEPALYNVAQQRQYMTIDYDAMMLDYDGMMEEYDRQVKEYDEQLQDYDKQVKDYDKQVKDYDKQVKDYDKQLQDYDKQVKDYDKQVKDYDKVAYENALLQIKLRYQEDASDWIRECTLEQLKTITILCFQDIDYETFKEKVFE